MNELYFGDNLEILKKLSAEHPKGFIDLIYIDPPFNSKRDYNILFESIDMKDTKAQKEAFSDTWSSVHYLDLLNELQETDLNLYKYLKTLDEIGIAKSSVAYLTNMAIRIYYMHKVLKDTGSFYLHCDPTMSHYLKIVCDMIFGESNYKNEIIWKRTFNSGSSKSIANKFPNSTDVILFFTKSNKYIFNKKYRPYSPGALKRYDKVDENGKRFKWNPLKTVSDDRLKKLISSGNAKIIPTSKYPIYKHYLDESKGAPIDNLWDDIDQMGTHSQERLGYPTQKPEHLLERIIETSSNKHDIVADFFCGCGTTIAVSERLKRKWFGVDISHLAIKLIVDRLTKPHGIDRAKAIKDNIKITGFPKDIASAKELAENTDEGRFAFQDWIIEVMLGGISNPKKTADGGWDGHLTFYKDYNEKGFAIIEVKSGKVSVKNIREFIQVVEKQNADLGLFVCFADQLKSTMLREAKEAGYFKHEHYSKIDKIQIITVEDLLDGKGYNLPGKFFIEDTFKKATKKILNNDEDQIQMNIE